jgi:hypothetical protein
MRIKKITAILLSAVMAISMCACTAKEEKVEKAPFDEAAYLESITGEVVDNLAQISKDEAYIKVYSYEDSVTEVAGKCGTLSADYTKGCYEIATGGEAMSKVLKAIDENDDTKGLSEFSKDYINKRMSGNLASLVNGRAGVNYVVVSSTLNYSRTYVPEEQIADRVRIIPTDDEKTFYFVSFVNTGDGALTVTATYIFCYGDVEEEFSDLFGITLTKVDK